MDVRANKHLLKEAAILANICHPNTVVVVVVVVVVWNEL
jgi:hypothetical protein